MRLQVEIKELPYVLRHPNEPTSLLTFPTPNAETAIFVDASVSGCGAVLQ